MASPLPRTSGSLPTPPEASSAAGSDAGVTVVGVTVVGLTVVGVTAAPVGNAEQLAALREDLAEAGYTVDRVGDVLGPMAGGALSAGQRHPADLATRASTDPVSVLLRLLVLGLSVSDAEVECALPRTGVAGTAALDHAGVVDAAAVGGQGPGHGDRLGGAGVAPLRALGIPGGE